VNVRRRLTPLTALVVVVAMPLLGLSGVASAKSGKTSASKCAKHSSKPRCAGGGANGSGTGGSSPQITVQLDPEPLVETGQSEVHVVIQVETLAAYAGDSVNIDSSQLEAACSGGLTFENLQVPGGGPQTVPPTVNVQTDAISAVLDNDGNATVIADGIDCAPGESVIEADLEVAPFLTALSTLVTDPPEVTQEGLSVNPRFGGLNQVLETGDTSTSGDSDVYAVFYVETNPVYAEQPVEISDNQLQDSCLGGFDWYTGDYNNIIQTSPPSETLDDDGNAVFVFFGTSCAATTSEVVADVDAGTDPTYITTFTVLPPAPTI
jgi:hypothetical protein